MPGITPSTRWSGRRAVREAGNAAAGFQTAWQGLMDSLMDQISDHSKFEREPLDEPAQRPRRRTWRTAAIVAATVLAALLVYVGFAPRRGSQAVALSTRPAGDGQPAVAARGRYQGWLPWTVLGDRPGRAQGAGRRHAHRNPFQGRADRPQGRPALRD